MQKIFNSELLNMGNGISPFHAWLLMRGMRTLPARLERITRSTKDVIEYLRQQRAVEEVIFPLDPAFPQYELAARQMKGACGLLTVVLKTEKMQDIVTFCESLQHILMAVSWGGYESLAIPRCASLRPEEFDPANRDHRMLRLYVGLEDAAYLIEDLDQAFSRIA
jgi:cystathionine beta-lyase/cystathionine gamma-synthase